MKWHRYLGWHWLDLGICQIDINDDSMNKCMLCELVGSIAHLYDVDADIVIRMPLVLMLSPVS
jgi:hypothetical protein